MVHQTISTSSAPAARASSKIKVMSNFLWRPFGALLWRALIVGTLAGCASAPPPAPVRPSVPAPAAEPARATPADAGLGELPPVSGSPMQRGKSRWVPVPWTDLPGLADDNYFEAWNAWIKSCERPGPAFAPLCSEVRQLSIADDGAQRRWMLNRLQPYRVESTEGNAEGLLTSYYEPLLNARRQRSAEFNIPLYRPPAGLATRKPWYSRQDIDTRPEPQAALRGREIAWLADPVDALLLQIQGSGRLQLTDVDGRVQLVRLAYAATNDQPYQSVARWLMDRGELREGSWRAVRDWAARNPQRVQELLWSNPRVVFFREEALPPFEAAFGPRGAQGVALTPGRSIAVDRDSIPYGTPVWLASPGPVAKLNRLVMAQDTGGAIVGAVRADYFAGWGDEAGELAARVKQPLRLWALWPR